MNKLLTFLGKFASDKLLPAIVFLVIGILAVIIIQKLLKVTLTKLKMDRQLAKLILGVIRPVLWILLGLIVATRLDIDVTSIVALASVLTLAISLSLQGLLGNVFGGFTLLYTKPFKPEDYVEIAGQSGTVKEVGLAYTKLATPDNKLISIPNSAVVAAEIVNYTTTGTRRVDITVTASYDSEPETVIEALLSLTDMPQILSDPAPVAVVSAYGESSISYCLRVWTATADYWDVNNSILARVKSTFAARGIQMTYPHLNVHMLEK